MDEEHLFRIALIIAFSGIVLLTIVSRTIETKDTTIHKMGPATISGTVLSVNPNEKVTFITLGRLTEMKVIAFDRINLMPGQNVSISGRMDDDEFLADEIILE